MEMEIKMKKLGFGTMRLPVLNQEDPASVDLEAGLQDGGYLYGKGIYLF